MQFQPLKRAMERALRANGVQLTQVLFEDVAIEKDKRVEGLVLCRSSDSALDG